MVKADLTPGMEMYNRQLALLGAKDVDALVENQYAPDAVLVRFDRVLRGHQELKDFFHGYIELLGDLEILSTDQFAETEDTVFFEATCRSNLGQVTVYDAWVLRDGKIVRHFTGVK